MRKVEVVPYNLNWTGLFQDECNKIKYLFGSEIIEIHHIGSTSIPNLHAKPVIDIIAEVKNIQNIDQYNQKMAQIGYEAMGENGIANRRFFMKGGNNRTHHIHVFETGNVEIIRHLAFRDYMLAHPDEARRYGLLKKELAEKYPFDIESYINGKNDYIKEIDQKAKKWIKY